MNLNEWMGARAAERHLLLHISIIRIQLSHFAHPHPKWAHMHTRHSRLSLQECRRAACRPSGRASEWVPLSFYCAVGCVRLGPIFRWNNIHNLVVSLFCHCAWNRALIEFTLEHRKSADCFLFCDGWRQFFPVVLSPLLPLNRCCC